MYSGVVIFAGCCYLVWPRTDMKDLSSMSKEVLENEHPFAGKSSSAGAHNEKPVVEDSLLRLPHDSADESATSPVVYRPIMSS